MNGKIVAIVGIVAVVIVAAAIVVAVYNDDSGNADDDCYTLEVYEEIHGNDVSPSQIYSIEMYLMDNSGKMTELGTMAELPKDSKQIATIMISAESGTNSIKWTYNADTKEFAGVYNNVKCVLKIDITGCENIDFRLSSDESPMIGFHYTDNVKLSLDFNYGMFS